MAQNFRNEKGQNFRNRQIIAKETCFAVKGGTAINLFVRDLPRLSVDIDLVYLPHYDRQPA